MGKPVSPAGFSMIFSAGSVLFTALFQAHPIKFANESGQYLRCQGLLENHQKLQQRIKWDGWSLG